MSWSRKIIAAFRQPGNAKKGVIVVEGRMVERLHLSMAERTVQIAEQGNSRDGDRLQLKAIFRPQQGDSFAGSPHREVR